jgi:hypothetical protein
VVALGSNPTHAKSVVESGADSEFGTSQPVTDAIASGQLSVAEELGPDIVTAKAAYVTGRLMVQVRALTGLEQAAPISIRLAHASITGRCGQGCYETSLPAAAQALVVNANIHGTTYSARLPVRFVPGDDQLAQTLLHRTDAGQLKLRSAVARQSLRNLPVTPEITVFDVQAPDRFAYENRLGGKDVNDMIIVGTTEWSRSAGERKWQQSSYGQQPFSAASYLTWWADESHSARLLDVYETSGSRVADIATLNAIPNLGVVWFRFHVDLTNDRLLSLRMITLEHFMTETWGAFNSAPPVRQPSAADVAAAG